MLLVGAVLSCRVAGGEKDGSPVVLTFSFHPFSSVVPLQDLSWTSLRASRIRTKRRSRDLLGPDSEYTPTESIQRLSPPHKVQQLVNRGKENQFVLARRSRRTRESTSGRNSP